MPCNDQPGDSSREPLTVRPKVSPRGRAQARPRRPPTPTALVVREDPPEGHTAPRRPGATLQILVLEERDDSLHNAVRTLTSAGNTPRTVYDEELAAAEILAGENTHFLLLTAYPTKRPLSVPQLIERLRQRRYGRTIRYCAKGKVSPETRVAYEALADDQVRGLPVRAQRSVLTAMAWLDGQVSFEAEGLTILESV